MVELAAIDEKSENKRNIIKKTLKQIRKEEEEADEACTLLDDMQQNTDDADEKITVTRSRLYRGINEYMHSWEQELGRRHHVTDKMWQMMQNSDTKTMNLDKDFNEMANRTKPKGWKGSSKKTRFWQKKRNTIR